MFVISRRVSLLNIILWFLSLSLILLRFQNWKMERRVPTAKPVEQKVIPGKLSRITLQRLQVCSSLYSNHVIPSALVSNTMTIQVENVPFKFANVCVEKNSIVPSNYFYSDCNIRLCFILKHVHCICRPNLDSWTEVPLLQAGSCPSHSRKGCRRQNPQNQDSRLFGWRWL